jgi:hypothetical protein
VGETRGRGLFILTGPQPLASSHFIEGVRA